MELVNFSNKEDEDESISVRETLQELIDDEEYDYEGGIVLLTTPEGHLVFRVVNMTRSNAYMTLGIAKQEILNT